MKYDREEAYLHEKLTGGLHPAGVDLWPAVAEHLPDAPPARHPRWKLAICLAAPLLIAAGVLAGTAEFTNLRENPRPSFAPEANTGYAITYERQYFTLDGDLMAGLVANHNGETAADGTAAQTLSDDDLELARRCQGRPAIAVLNKQDLAGETDVPRGTLEPYFKKIVPMCARDAVGLQALTDAVADLLGTAQLDPEAAQLCSARQLAAATRARDALAEAIAARQNGFGLDAAAVCLTDALQALFDLTGENASDATIEEVFETFCVGK